MKRWLGAIILTHCIVAGAWAKSSSRIHSVTFSTNFPHVTDLNYDIRVKPWLSLGLAGGYFGMTFQSSQTGPIVFSTHNYEAHVRVHPFSGAFFLGLLLGRQTFSGETSRAIAIPQISTSVDLTASATISSSYLTPHLGWFWRWDSGFTFGFDVGWQISFSPATTISVPLPTEYSAQVQATAEYQDLQSDIQEVGNKFATQSLPFVTLLRLGWSF